MVGGLKQGIILNEGSGSTNRPNPNGNVWPVDPTFPGSPPWPIDPSNTFTPAQLLAAWRSPLNWTSIRNDNTAFDLEYWAYNNEFVWPMANNTLTTKVKMREDGEQIMMYRTGIPNPPLDDPGMVVYRGQCNTDLPNVFPLRMAVDPSGNAVTSTFYIENGDRTMALLGDAIPNPASTKVAIPVYIQEKSNKSYLLSIFDLSGKKVLVDALITEKGNVHNEFPLLNLPAGVYGYSLRENGKTLGTRKLVVIK